MTLQNIPGSMLVPIGSGWNSRTAGNFPAVVSTVLDATNEALICLGYIATSDGGSHTIDTTGSSSIGWAAGTTTFANGATVFKVGVAAVDTAIGPPGRAVNSSDVITFDVSAVFTGSGVTTGVWNSSVPTTGTKTIANGDLVAVGFQCTNRAGIDAFRVNGGNAGQQQLPASTTYLSAVYADSAVIPNMVITFSDGALGYFYGTDVATTISVRTFSSGDATKEYGQLFQLPFPTKIAGLYGWIDPDANCDLILYSDPLGTPVAEKTVTLDANVMSAASGRRFTALFGSPYTTTANQIIAASFKPGASNISAYYKTLNNAAHRIVDPWGTGGYGVSRATGAFSDANSSLDHYYIGLMVSAFDDGAGGGGGGGLSTLGGRGGVIS